MAELNPIQCEEEGPDFTKMQQKESHQQVTLGKPVMKLKKKSKQDVDVLNS